MSRKGENITKRKDGRWEARYIYSYDENNRAKYRYLYGKTYSEARAKKEYAQSQFINGSSNSIEALMTLNDLFKEFLIYKKPQIKISTLSHYENLYLTYISNYFKDTRLIYLTPKSFESYIFYLVYSGGSNKSGLSDKTVRDIISFTRSALKYGVTHKYITKDILSFYMPKYSQNEASVFEKQEQEKLEEFILSDPDSYKIGVYLALYAGLRIGELCALKWSDIDLEHSEIHINKTIQRIKIEGKTKTKVIIAEPKTRSSIRTIPIVGFLANALKLQKLLAEDEDCYVLTGTSNYIEPSNYYMKYIRWLKRIGISHHSFHTLRHTFATRCIESGFDAKTLSEILGHSDVKITLNRYVHPSMELKKYHMNKLSSVYMQ